MIVHSNDIQANICDFGGKASGLFFLKKNHFEVPDFYLIGKDDVGNFIQDKNLIKFSVGQWIKNYNIPLDKLWAVRSSAGVEDGEKFSHAGLFATRINVLPENLTISIQEVIDSYEKASSLNYGFKHNSYFSIIIQEMVQPDYSGVIFSEDPTNLKEKGIVLNILPGLGEYLVSGEHVSLSGVFNKGKLKWKNPENEYTGKVFKGYLLDVSVKGTQIISDIKHIEKHLISGTQKLASLKKHPVDIEFCISEGRVSWLQLRPITTISAIDKGMIFDNSNIGENFPGITLPLSISFVKHTYKIAYSSMASHLGMNNLNLRLNEPLFSNMVGGIYGAMYYNITAWQQLLYQIPFGKKNSKLLPELLGMEPAEFDIPSQHASGLSYLKGIAKTTISLIFFSKIKKKYEVNCNHVLSSYNQVSFNDKNHNELINIYFDIEKKLSNNWIAPVLNGFFAMIFFSLLKNIFKKSRLVTEYPNFINDMLFSQGDIISVRIVREFQMLIAEIHDDATLKLLFNINTPEIIYKVLATEHPEFIEKIDSYISNYGARCEKGELKMETINYQEKPVSFIAYLKSNLISYSKSSKPQFQFNYKTCIHKAYKFNFLKKYFLLFLIRLTLHRIRDRENYRYVRTQTFALIRRIFRAIDETLLKNQLIVQQGDSLYLNHDEILSMNLSSNYIQIIGQRKEEFRQYEKIEHANRYMIKGDKIIPVEKILRVANNKQLRGIGCCSGIVSGKVKLLQPGININDDYSDNILIASYFEPGSINLFGQAKGLVSEKGNLLSHTAILCREMGIPSIIGVKNITAILKEGDLIQINGSTGEINIV